MAIERARITDWVARCLVIIPFGGLMMNLLAEFQRTGHITGLLLLLSEALVVGVVLTNRSTPFVDRSAGAVVITLMSVYGPTLLRAEPGVESLAPDVMTGLVSAGALLLVVTGMFTVGRSLGPSPANRGNEVGGPYNVVRHPIYTGYLVMHVAFLCAQPTMWNLLLIVMADGALVLRALFEERVLLADNRYREYCQRVGWHLVPGVF